uniref:Glycosyltransferase 2-like domain-containing protein n=1 Tax=Periophthalmus magnuspinnatus TaxID=409849 RepID=A0A3B3ZS69_9GOBI
MSLCIRALFRRRTVCLWGLLLGFAALSLTLTDLLNQSQYRDWTQGESTAPVPPLRFASPPELEVMVDSRDAASQRGVKVPLDSLQEDQLLSVPTLGAQHSTQKRSYKLLMPRAVKEPRGSAHVTHAQHGPQSAWRQSVPLRRSLPESRAPGCLGGQYPQTLPSVSMVLCFRDPPLSSLLQTVHSVLHTAPPLLLQEVLLLDDHSHSGELRRALPQYVSHLRGVRLIRSPRPLGPGRCRSLGASRATGDVLVFMDPRSEPHTGWLEPLLERVAQDRTLVVSPLLDVLDAQSRKYSASPWPLRGVWDWRLDFHWDPSSPPNCGSTMLLQLCVPFRSPALGGEVLAVDRLFFNRLGAYDPGTVAWSLQQVELSFRVWSCGGALEVVPCSRVALRRGHSALYEEPDPEQLQQDRVRVAEAWMGPYKEVFYRRSTLAHSIRQVEAPNVTAWLQMQKTLGCKDFSWYLSSVSPDLHVPQDLPGLSGEVLHSIMSNQTGTHDRLLTHYSSGQMRWGPRADLCLDLPSHHLLLSPCGTQTAPPASQHWSYRKVWRPSVQVD